MADENGLNLTPEEQDDLEFLLDALDEVLDDETPDENDGGSNEDDVHSNAENRVVNGIKRAKIDAIVEELGTDTKQLIRELWMHGLLGGAGGDGGVWTREDPTTATVGGCPAGSVLVGLTAIEILEIILYIYQKPRFTSAAISTFKSTKEVGEPVGGNGVLTFAIANADNVEPKSLVLTDHTGKIIAKDFDTSSQQLLFDSWTSNKIGTTTWTLKGKDTEGADFSTTISISWQANIHWGTSENTVIDAIAIQALSNKKLGNRYAGTYSYGEGGYKYVAFPASFGTPSKYDNPENNMEVPVTEEVNKKLTNQYGVELEYKVIRTTLSLKGSIQVRLA